MIGRRGFLQAIGAAVLGLSIALRPQDEPETVSVRYPMRFKQSEPATCIPIDLTQQFGVDFEWTSIEESLSL